MTQTSGDSPAAPQPSGSAGRGDYEVKQGDCIESIAFEHGHFWQTLWNDPGNQDLRSVRKNPNVLLSGDRVAIPPLRVSEDSCATDHRHRFLRKGVPSKLQIRLLDADGNPRANLKCVVDIDGTRHINKTDADGWVRLPITPNAKAGKIIIEEDGVTESYVLNLGHLDPIKEIAGIQQRLENLGYSCIDERGSLGDRTKAALRRFQKQYGLNESGEVDQTTTAKLHEIYGS